MAVRMAWRTMLLVFAMGFASCGGGSGPSSPAAPGAVTRGLLGVTQTADGVIGLSPRPGLIRLAVPVEVRALNEIPLTLSNARLTLYDQPGNELQRAELTAAEIAAQAGTLQVTRDRALAFTVIIDYVPQNFDHLTFFLTAVDANGISVSTSLTGLRWVLDPALQ
jgi:hypothetical protein